MKCFPVIDPLVFFVCFAFLFLGSFSVFFVRSFLLLNFEFLSLSSTFLKWNAKLLA